MILITTPTGTIGSQVLENAPDSDESVRVIVRDQSRLSPKARDRVDVVEGSHGDADVVKTAFADVDAVFWLCPPNPTAATVDDAFVGFTRPAADAFRTNGVKRVVGITGLGRGTPMAADAGFVTASLAMDDLITSTGVSYRALTMPSFMDNIARQAEPISRQGLFFSPIDGDRKLPSVATRDIASVATRWLLDDTWSGVEEVPVLGPEDLSFNDMAAIMSDVLEQEVRFQQIPFAAYKEQFLDRGMSEAMAQGMTDMAAAKNEGLDNSVARTPEATTPTSFRQWCAEELKPLVVIDQTSAVSI
jgi:uncharacterized protein YbjT (DUF2867 family)